MSVLILIPARMASTRLPGKPLADIAGRPMIVHVAERAAESGLGRVVVATDTPDALVDRLTEATGTTARSLEDVRRTIGAAASVDQARAYALMAVFCALVALIALAAGVARHLRGYRRDVASLRLLGVGLGAARRAGRAEMVALAAVVLVAVLFVTGAFPDLPDAKKVIEDIATALGPWTYLLVGALAFLETGAFVGLVAPHVARALVGGRHTRTLPVAVLLGVAPAEIADVDVDLPSGVPSGYVVLPVTPLTPSTPLEAVKPADRAPTDIPTMAAAPEELLG